MTPIFLTIPEVVQLQKKMLERWGGQQGIRDEGLLSSATRMPEASWGGEFLHSYPFEMAAACAFHLAENQPFVDGNKRTAIGAALIFLRVNGYRISDSTSLYPAMIAIAKHELNKPGLARILEDLSVRVP